MDTKTLLVLRAGNQKHYPAGTIKDGENVGGQFAESPYAKSTHPSILAWEQAHGDDPKEALYLINSQGNVGYDSIQAQAGSKRTGRLNRVDIPMSHAAHVLGGVYTHNHPVQYDSKGMQQMAPGFSVSDIVSAASFGVKEIRATDRFHVFSMKLSGKKEPYAKMYATTLSKDLTQATINKMRAGMDESEANARYADEFGKSIARRFGGEYSVYDRKTGTRLDATPFQPYKDIRSDATKAATPEQLKKREAAAAKRQETMRAKRAARLVEIRAINEGFRKAGWK